MELNLSKLGVKELNPMQELMLSEYPTHRHIVLLSPTGSGKTLAYLLPLLQTIDSSSDALQALIVVPSRELAIQTQQVMRELSSTLRSYACYGGRPTMDEHRVIRSLLPHVIVGTPGRILDHFNKENFSSQHIHSFVIDEFDKCLELGFQQQIADVRQFLVNATKCVLLSATDSPHISMFFNKTSFEKYDFLPEHADSDDSRLSLHVISSPQKDKLQTLLQLVCQCGQQSSLVFVNYRESVERICNFLVSNGVCADSFHGAMEQRDREKALYRFSNGSCNVLVSTDLASRGLDIPDIQNVIHYHLPLSEDAYIHRNGRTARWESLGTAWMILGPEESLPSYLNQTLQVEALSAFVPNPSLPKWVTLYIGKGKKDKINRIDVAGFLSKVGGLSREEIGRIDVLPGWAFVAIKRARVQEVLDKVKGQKIKGKKTIIELAE